MHRSLGFGSTPCYLCALFRLAFATVTPEFGLALQQRSNSPDHYSIGTPSVYRSSKGSAFLRPLVGIRFQVLFHSPPGVLFTFPSRYWSTIGHREVFSLAGWSRRIHTEFHVLRTTRELRAKKGGWLFVYGAFTLCGAAFHLLQLNRRFVTFRPDGSQTHPDSHNPDGTTPAGFNMPIGLGSFRFARRY